LKLGFSSKLNKSLAMEMTSPDNSTVVICVFLICLNKNELKAPIPPPKIRIWICSLLSISYNKDIPQKIALWQSKSKYPSSISM